MNLNEQVAALIETRKLIETGVEPILTALKDKDLSLEKRWETYTLLVKNKLLIREQIYGDGFIDTLGDNMTLYDDFHMERHETRSFIDMYEHIMEADGEWQKSLVEAREANLANWQETVLASGYSEFTFDW